MPDGWVYDFPMLDLLDIGTIAAATHNEQSEGFSTNWMVDEDAFFWLDRTNNSVRIYPRTTSLCAQSVDARVKGYFGKNARVQKIEPGMKVLSTNHSCWGPTTNDHHVCVGLEGSMVDAGRPYLGSDDTAGKLTTVLSCPYYADGKGPDHTVRLQSNASTCLQVVEG